MPAPLPARARAPRAPRFRAASGAALAALLAACAGGPPARSAVEADPLFAEARRDLAAGRPVTATEKFESLLLRYGQETELLRWLGRARLSAGKERAGRENLRAVLASRPGDPQATRWLADAYFDAGTDLDANAVELYEQLLAADPENEHVLRRLAELHLRGGEERQALRHLEPLLARRPEDGGLRRQAMLAADGSADWEALERHAAAAIAAEGPDPTLLQARARALAAGDPASASADALRAAIPVLGEAVLLDPNAAGLAYDLGLVHLHLARALEAGEPGRARSERQEAERWLRRALDVDPALADAAQTLAALYLDERNPQRALPYLEHALQLLLEEEARTQLGLHADRIRTLRTRLEEIGG